MVLPALPGLLRGIRLNEEALEKGLLEASGMEMVQTAGKEGTLWFGAASQEAGKEAPPQDDSSAGLSKRDQECNADVPNSLARKSAWRRWSAKCKCKKGMTLQCPDKDCEALGRQFNAAAYKDKSCRCGVCEKECGDIVRDGKTRNSAWRRWGKVCKCEKGFELMGSDEACQSLKGTRYYSKKDLRGKHCFCSNALSTTAGDADAVVAINTTTIEPLLEDRIATRQEESIACKRSRTVLLLFFVAVASLA